MPNVDLRRRTYRFALNIIKLFSQLPENNPTAQILGKQLLRCGTSVGANYRAACLAKSGNDFIAKIKICEEEADESVYWLQLLIDTHIVPASTLKGLADEARQLSAIMSASARTRRSNLNIT